MWYNEIDKTFLINLPMRTDRLRTVSGELTRHKIPYTVVPAIQDPIGAKGLFLTTIAVLEAAKERNLKSIMVLEDDVKFSTYSMHGHLNNTFKELRTLKWDMFYLGANVVTELIPVKGCKNLFGCGFMVATHAIVYSSRGIDKCLKALQDVEKKGWTTRDPIDMIYAREVQKDSGCFISNPMLAYQRPGYSDIEKRDTDYTSLLERRFGEQLKKINL